MSRFLALFAALLCMTPAIVLADTGVGDPEESTTATDPDEE